MLTFFLVLFILGMLWLGFHLTGALLAAFVWLIIKVPLTLILWCLGLVLCCTILLIPVGIRLLTTGLHLLFP